MELIYSKRFKRTYQKITKNSSILENKIINTLTRFQEDKNHPSIRLHKLKSTEYWSISVNMCIRIIFIYQNDKVILLDIGDHSIYD